MSEWILHNEISLLDLSQISHLCCALMRDLAEVPIPGSHHQDSLTNWVLSKYIVIVMIELVTQTEL